MSCDALQKEWSQCLSRSNRNPSKCQEKEAELRKCAKNATDKYCVDETVSLMECTRDLSVAKKADFCAKQFIAMRECNRPGGPHLIANTDGGYSIAESAKSLYNEHASLLQVPAVRSKTGIAGLVKEAKERLGIPAEIGLRF